jgi:hypothetical protein
MPYVGIVVSAYRTISRSYSRRVPVLRRAVRRQHAPGLAAPARVGERRRRLRAAPGGKRPAAVPVRGRDRATAVARLIEPLTSNVATSWFLSTFCQVFFEVIGCKCGQERDGKRAGQLKAVRLLMEASCCRCDRDQSGNGRGRDPASGYAAANRSSAHGTHFAICRPQAALTGRPTVAGDRG